MKIIAHRNETPGCPENSIASLVYSAQDGIFAVECDVRRTLDGEFVIYHDESLKRLAGNETRVDALSLAGMRAALKAVGREVITLDALIRDYPISKPILLHIKERSAWPKLVKMLKTSRVEFIFGVESLEMLAELGKFTSKDHLLAFMPRMDMYPGFIAGGAGIIRLWEDWLDSLTPDTVHASGVEQVWIMSNTKTHGLDGTPESLDMFVKMHADGALVSDMAMARAWLDSRS